MKTIKVDGKKYQLPQVWEEVTLSSFLVYDTHTGREHERQAAVMSEVSGIPLNLIMDSEISFFNLLRNQLDFLFSTVPESDKIRHIRIDEQDFYYEAFSSINFAQFVDCETRLDEFSKDDRVSMESYPYILGILYLPKGEKYNSEVSAKRAELFRSIDMVQAAGAINFFLWKRERFKKVQELSNQAELLRKKVVQPSEDLPNHGRGQEQSLTLQST